jgi:hypothetical protein
MDDKHYKEKFTAGASSHVCVIYAIMLANPWLIAYGLMLPGPGPVLTRGGGEGRGEPSPSQ